MPWRKGLNAAEFMPIRSVSTLSSLTYRVQVKLSHILAFVWAFVSKSPLCVLGKGPNPLLLLPYQPPPPPTLSQAIPKGYPLLVNSFSVDGLSWTQTCNLQHCNQMKSAVKTSINPCPAEYIKIPCPLLILSQSDYMYLIQFVDTNLNT